MIDYIRRVLQNLDTNEKFKRSFRDSVLRYFEILSRHIPSNLGTLPELDSFVSFEPSNNSITVYVYFEHNWSDSSRRSIFAEIERMARLCINQSLVRAAPGVVTIPSREDLDRALSEIVINVRQTNSVRSSKSQSLKIKCSECEGSGEKQCAQCLGSGRHGTFPDPTDCVYCYGKGHIECSNCGGSGWRS